MPAACAIALTVQWVASSGGGASVRRTHLGDPVLSDGRLARRPHPVLQQAVDTGFHKSLLPAPYARLRLTGGGHDAVRADAVGSQKHDPGTPNMLLRRLRIGDDGLKTPAIGG